MTKKMNIPFSPPDISEKEIEAVSEALRSGWITTGPRTKELERQMAEYKAGLISQRTRQSLQAKKARGCRLGKSENLTNNLERAIGESVKTNKTKADNNPNNMPGV